MPAGTRWLNLTLPVAAFLGSAAGSVAVQRFLTPPPPSLPPGVVAFAAPAQVLPGPNGQPGAPEGHVPGAYGFYTPVPEAPGPSNDTAPALPPPPAGLAPTADGAPVAGTDESQLLAEMGDWYLNPNPPLPPGFFDLPPAPTGPNAPPILHSGLIIQVEVLESLPGRPIGGQCLIRGDGTISLGFYGDLPVAGLNRYQVKVRLLEHLRKYLTEPCLGLRVIGPDGKTKIIPPVESDRVFVYDSIYVDPRTAQPVPPTPEAIQAGLYAEVQALSAKLDQVLKQADRSGMPGPGPRAPGRSPAEPNGKGAPAAELPAPDASPLTPPAPPPAPGPASAEAGAKPSA